MRVPVSRPKRCFYCGKFSAEDDTAHIDPVDHHNIKYGAYVHKGCVYDAKVLFIENHDFEAAAVMRSLGDKHGIYGKSRVCVK